MSEPVRVRVAIVDDEPLARESLRRLPVEDPEVEVVAECGDGRVAPRVLREARPDLVFLDVRMPGADGFEVLAALPPEERPLVVFVTAFDRYALQAFEVHAVDYVLKPFDDERFRIALERAKETLRRERVVDAGRRLADLLEAVGPAAAARVRAEEASPRRIPVPHAGRVEFVDVDELVWVEAADQYVRLHTAEGAVHLLRDSLSALEERLDPARFLRVHRSAIVALDRVRRFERGPGGGRVLVEGGAWIPVSRSRAAELRARLGAG